MCIWTDTGKQKKIVPSENQTYHQTESVYVYLDRHRKAKTNRLKLGS